MDGRTDFFRYGEVTITFLKLPVIDAYNKKNPPKSDRSGRKHRRQNQLSGNVHIPYYPSGPEGERSGLQKTALLIYTDLVGYIYVYLRYRRCFFFRVKSLLCYIHLACGIKKMLLRNVMYIILPNLRILQYDVSN